MTHHHLTSPVEVSLMKVWLERLVYAFMIAFSTIALFLLVVVIQDAYFNNPPIEITNRSITPTYNICPGDLIETNYHVNIKEPTIISAYSVVMNKDGTKNIFETASDLPVRVFPYPVSLDSSIPWHVPELGPGEYMRVIAIRGHNRTQDPTFLFTKFTVKENCE